MVVMIEMTFFSFWHNIDWVIYLNLSFNNGNYFVVFVNNLYLDFDLEDNLYECLKKILLNLKKRYAIDIYGYFETDIYKIDNVGTFLEFNRIDDDSFNIKNIDLKINIHNSVDAYLKFSDYFIIDKYKNIEYKNGYYYIDAKNIEKEDIIRLSDYYVIDYIK